MDRLTHLSLFSGIGGLDLAAEWAGFQTVGQCEWADYPTKVLEKHWPDVPRWKDIRTLTKEDFYERTGLHTVDVISGGFPCQPFSVAGKRRGREDDRYLWPEMVRVIKELRSAWVVGENVAGIIRMALPDILSELEACGYRTRAFLIPACAVGARHRRYRVAIVGYSESVHKGRLSIGTETAFTGFVCGGKNVAHSEGKGSRGLPVQQGRPRQEGTNTERGSENVQHTDCAGCEEQYTPTIPNQQGFDRGGCAAEHVSDADRSTALRREAREGASGQDAGNRNHIGNGEEEHAEWQRRTVKPGLGGVADGISDRLDEDLEWLAENAGDLRDDDDYLEWYWNDFVINHYWDTEPDIPRVAAGVPHRVDRLKALGNAVVPQQFYPVFKAIAGVERRIRTWYITNTDLTGHSGNT